MLRIVIADWRRILLFYLAGTALWLIVHFLIVREVSGDCCGDDPVQQLRFLKLLFLDLVYGSCSMVFWAQGGMYDKCRLKLTETLPISPDALNLTRILMCAGHFVPSLLNWTVVFATWRHLDLTAPLWVAALALVSLAAYVLVCLRFLVLRYALPVLFPVLFAPQIEQWFAGALHWSTTPWPSTVVAGAVAIFAVWAIRQPPPRWTRG